MKVIITGHKSGIGKAIADLLKQRGYEIIGFDLQDGFNIAEPSNLNSIVQQFNEADVFINNAYHPTAQTALLRKAIRAWQNSEKIIVHIGSLMALGTGETLKHFEDLVDQYSNISGHTYINTKREQMEIINTEYFNSDTKIIHLMLSATKTSMLGDEIYPYPTLNPKKIAKIVEKLLKQDDDCFIRQVIVSNMQ